MTTHPDLAEEQAYVDHAYACLERSRADAWRLRDMTEVGRGGTHQARYEAEVFEGAISQRLTRLELGDAALVFGRIDRYGEGGVESFHIGRHGIENGKRKILGFAKERRFRELGGEVHNATNANLRNDLLGFNGC